MNQVSTWALCLVLFVSCWAVGSSLPFLKGQCLVDGRLDSVCYECAKRFRSSLEDYKVLYISCCEGDVAIRDYCYSIYTEGAKEGGLWL